MQKMFYLEKNKLKLIYLNLNLIHIYFKKLVLKQLKAVQGISFKFS